MEGLLTLLLSDKLNLEVSASKREPSEETEKLKEEIRKSLTEKKAATEPPAPAAKS